MTSPRPSWNRRFAVAGVVSGVVLAAALEPTVFGAQAGAATSHLPTPYLGKLVHGSSIASTPKLAATSAARAVPAASALPSPGSFVLSLGAPTASARTSAGGAAVAPAVVAGWKAIGTSGLAVAPLRSSAKAPSRLKVEILSAADAQKLGLSGLVLRVSRADGVASAAPVAVRIPNALLSGLYGADYASRVQWVSLPASVTSKRLSAGSTKPTSLVAARTAASSVVAPQITAQPLVVTPAATPVSSSGSGSWAATSLTATGSFQVSNQTGSFSWSYPMRVPPIAAGPSPNLSLSYDSGAIDGETASTNNQSSVIGDGWQLGGGGFIERSYTPCIIDGTGLTGDQAASGDLCWSGENDNISFAGHSGALVPDGKTDEYRIQGDDGSRVQYLATSSTCADGGSRNGCWLLTTQDGTQYFFGRSAASAWTVPVFGDDVNEPCHATGLPASTTFANSSCTQVWRWNLDRVQDIHGNAENFKYTLERNYYHKNRGALVSYVRSGYLTEIDYGISSGGTYPSAKVILGYDTYGRCNVAAPSTSTCAVQNGATFPTPAHPANYPDVPWDQNCVSGGTCTALSTPTFWTTQMLDTVTTSGLVSGTFTPADVWTLHHAFYNPGDTSAASMFLSSISHPNLPDTTFHPASLNNRVDPSTYVPLAKMRIGSIDLDTGGTIGVSYESSDCTATMIKTLNPAANTHRCFPQWWSPTPGIAPVFDWFNKYRVQSVVQAPNMPAAIDDPSVETFYTYPGGPAWRLDNSLTTQDSRRTWSVFAGYKQVEVRTGDPGTPSLQEVTDYTYLQGLSGDPDGTANNHYRTSSPVIGGHTITDFPWWAGTLVEAKVFNGVGGDPVSDTVTVPWGLATAPLHRAISFPNPNGTGTFSASVNAGAYMTGTLLTDTTTPGPSGNETVTVTTGHDTYGRVTSVSTQTPDAGSTCSTTEYATDPTGQSDSALWLLDLPSRVTVVGKDCSTAPTLPADAVSDTRFFYDGATSFDHQMLTKGNLTRTDVVKGYSGSTPILVTTATSPVNGGYDNLGRLLRVTNEAGLTTATTYAPPASGPYTGKTITTNGLDVQTMSSTTNYSTLWTNSPTTVTDVNSGVTTATYDSLGRLSSVWLADHPQSTFATPSLGYSYVQTTNKPLEVTASTLNPTGGTISTYAFADGLGRSIQTQSAMDVETSSGAHVIGGTIVATSYYDQAGRVRLTDDAYGTTDITPTANLFAPTAATQVPRQTQTTYDGAGRTTAAITLGLRSDSTFGELWRTGFAYPNAHRVNTTPPAGGTATATVTDSLGRTSHLYQYLGSTLTGTAQDTSYGYDARGDMTSMQDPAGHQWSWVFDVLGRQTKAIDPDTGTTTSSYDDAGNLATTVNTGSGVDLAYAYDMMGRRTKEYDHPTHTTDQALIASWSYDSATLGLGLLAQSVSYVGSTAEPPTSPDSPGDAYTKQVNAYNAVGKPTSTSTVIPNWNGSTATFNSTLTYDMAGNLSSYSDDPMGGLPRERPAYYYDDLNNLMIVNGTVQYLGDVKYNSINLPVLMDFTNGTTVLNRQYTYDDNTNRLTDLLTETNASTGFHTADHRYTYTNSGLITSDSNTADGQGTDTQCYTYDGLQELTEVWTPSSNNCATAKSPTSMGGPSPYWQTYTYDTTTGNRLTTLNHALNGSGTSERDTYHYPAGAQPHTATSVTTETQPAAGGAWTTGPESDYQYTDGGQTKQRPGETLTWNSRGDLDSVSTTGGNTVSNIYDADGNLLIRDDSTTGRTLYLGDTELNIAPGSTVVTATRTYTANGAAVAERITTPAAPTTSTLYWLNPAPGQNTAGDEVNATTLSTRHRYLDPFGNLRTGSTTSWTSSHGFLNQTVNATTDTVHLGARDYDPVIGRFLSSDPVLDAGDPLQNNGYSYAENEPIGHSDPSGQLAGCADSCSATQTAGMGNSVGSAPGVTTGTTDPGVTVTGNSQSYPDGTNASSNNGHNSIDNITIPTTKDTHVSDIYLFLAEFEAYESNVESSVYGMHPEIGDKWSTANLWDAIMDFCDSGKSSQKCSGTDIMTGGAVGLKETLQAVAAVDIAAAGIGKDGISAGGRTNDAIEEGVVPGSRTEASCGGGSFSSDTRVVMADGTTKALTEIRVGEMVEATDTATGKTTARTVSRVWINHDTDLMDVTLDVGGTRALIHGTQDHLFWSSSRHSWVKADHLKIGERLHTNRDVVATVTKTEELPGTADMWDLTVSNDHDFYVVTAIVPVLVHNNSGNCPPPYLAAEQGARMTTKQATALAKYLGYTKTKEYSHGQPVYTNGKTVISPDADGHSRGAWKMARTVDQLNANQRMGTYDFLLNWIAP